MTKSASTQAVLAILLGGALATLATGCRTEEVAIGQQNATGGQGANKDAAAGGAGGGTTSAGGAIASGGSAQGGGLAAVGGANASGGSATTGGVTAAGGAKTTGGATGAGGSGAGGSAGCAPGWTLCCGQCLSPQAGVCAACPATGGAGPTGGAPNTGGGAGTAGIGAGGSTGTGGSTAAGGSTGAGGSGAGGASGVVCGGLHGMSCSTGQFCDLPAGSCNSADMTGTCVAKNMMVCPAIFQPVCGCDGRTYGNDCERILAGATKKSSGACATTDAGTCPSGQTWCPGCASLGIPGSCGQVCTAMVCPVVDAGPADVTSASCSDVTTRAACDSRSDCHSVFVDPGNCACAALGCCARFDRCADGGRASCTNTGTSICLMVMPHCESPYVVSYTGGCYEGCVLPAECAGAI